MKRIILLPIIVLFPFFLWAKDYNASLFSIYADGQTNNTKSIQKAIDFIHENGGGRLVFYVGRYLTGTIFLKSNVTIKLEEGAVLVGASSLYDYNSKNYPKAIIESDNQNNIGITGKGVIEGNAYNLNKNILQLSQNKYIDLNTEMPSLIFFKACNNVNIDTVNLWQSANNALQLDSCSNTTINNINIDSKNVVNSNGIVIIDCTRFSLTNSFINTTSNSFTKKGKNVEIKIEKTIKPSGKLVEF